MNSFERGYNDTMEKVALIGLIPKGVGTYMAIGAGQRAADDPERGGFSEGMKAAAPFTGGFSLLNALMARSKYNKAMADPAMRKQLASMKKQGINLPKKQGLASAILAGLLLGTISTTAFGGIPGAISETSRLKKMKENKTASLAFLVGYKEAMEKVAGVAGIKRKGCLPEELLPTEGTLLKKIKRQRMMKRS